MTEEAKKIDDGGQAFPLQNGQYAEAYGGSPGMSLRDWLAGNIVTGLISSRESQQALYADASAAGMDSADYVADAAYEMADAMIASRKKRGI